MQLTIQRDTLTPILAGYLLRAKDPRVMLEPMGVALWSMAKRAHVDASLRPHVWPPLSGGARATLQQTTMMRRAWRTVALGKDFVTVGNDAPYAAVHHNGGKARTIEGKGGGALRFQIGGVTIVRRKVKHPGTPKRRALPVEDDGRLTPHAEKVILGIAVRRAGMA